MIAQDLIPEVTPLAVAVLEGDVEAMVWLMQLFDEKGLEWRDDSGPDLSLLAAERGKIESLTCLRANGCPWDDGRGDWRPPGGASVGASERVSRGTEEDVLVGGVRGGHLEVLQWAHQNGCPWDRGTCEAAAQEGHLQMLQWARQNGCPWNA